MIKDEKEPKTALELLDEVQQDLNDLYEWLKEIEPLDEEGA